MGEILFFALVAYGACNIMIYGSIFARFRRLVGADLDEPTSFFGKLFSCMMCLPFWWGVILSIFMYSPTLMYASLGGGILFDRFWYGDYNLLAIFFDACLASGCVWLIHTIQERLET